MKVLFLDIDGVLNFDGTEAKTPSGCDGIVDRLVKKLKSIIDNTNALVVLSSDWKVNWYKSAADITDLPMDGQYLVRKLKRNGVHINSKTDDKFPESYRGAAIMDWISRHNGVDGWCVLDDVFFDDYMMYPEISNHIVLTDPRVGLTDDDAASAIDILNNQR